MRYTYHNYPDCPRATKYSKNAEGSAAYGRMLLIPIAFYVLYYLLDSNYDFILNLNWLEYLLSILLLFVAELYFLYAMEIRENNIQCKINIILMEESNKSSSKDKIKYYTNCLKEKNHYKNKDAFMRFLRKVILINIGLISFLNLILGIYFVYQNMEGIIGLLIGSVGLCIFFYVYFAYGKKKSYVHNTKNESDKQGELNSSRTFENDNTQFCRKCGHKLLPDSLFCSKCGEKIK